MAGEERVKDYRMEKKCNKSSMSVSDVLIVYKKLPLSTKGFSFRNSDSSYTVVLNENIKTEEQKKDHIAKLLNLK